MSIELELQRFIMEKISAPGGRNEVVGVDEPLVSSGRIDSLGLLEVLTYIEQRFGVDLLAHGEPSDFDTIRGLANAVQRRPA